MFLSYFGLEGTPGETLGEAVVLGGGGGVANVGLGELAYGLISFFLLLYLQNRGYPIGFI